VPLKFELGVFTGQSKWQNSIDHIQLLITVRFAIGLTLNNIVTLTFRLGVTHSYWI